MKKTIVALMALVGVASAASVGYNSMTDEQKSGVQLAWDFSGGSASPVVGSVNETFTLSADGSAAHLTSSDGTHPWSNSLTDSFSSGDFTLSLDVNSFTANNWQALVSLYSVGGSGDSKCLQIGVNTQGQLAIFNEVGGATGYASIDTEGNILTGLVSGFSGASTLTLVSDMTNSKTLSVYVDGKLVGSHSNWSASTDQALMGIQVGSAFGGGRIFPEAEISNITLWNKALSFSEVKALIVPEPTTATLSLLALAGLAARRRRK